METTELEKQIVDLTDRVYNLEVQIKKLLQNNPEVLSTNKTTEENVCPPAQPAESQRLEVSQTTSKREEIQQSINKLPPVNQLYEKEENKNEPSQNLESRIGKSIMGVAASVLIIFSLILFGKIIYPNLSDPMKVFIMFALSFVMAIPGIIKMNSSSKYNSLWTSLAGCGVTASYVSILITFFKFKLIPSFSILNIILILWLIWVGWLAKYKSKFFLYICNIGLIIGSYLNNSNTNEPQVGVLMYLIGIGILFVNHQTKSYAKDCYFFSQIHLNSLIYTILYKDFAIIPTVIAVTNIPLYIFELCCYKAESKQEIGLTIANQILTTFNCLYNMRYLYCWNNYENSNYVLLSTLFTAILYAKYNRKLDKLWQLSYYLDLIHICVLVNKNQPFIDYLSYLPFCIVLLVLDHFLNNTHFRRSSIVLMIFSFWKVPKLVDSYALLAVAIAFVIYYAYKYFRDKYSFTDKLLLASLLIISIDETLIQKNACESIAFLAKASLCIFFNTRFFLLDYKSLKEEGITTILSNIFNLTYIIKGIKLVAYNTDSYLLSSGALLTQNFVGIILITLLIILSSINIKRHYRLEYKGFVSFYTCSKILVVLFAIMHRLSLTNTYASLIAIIFAVICVGIGLILNIKPVRLYGLALNLIFVLKIILFDIRYNNDIQKPLSFLGAGILCLAISWLYSKLEKHITEKQQ